MDFFHLIVSHFLASLYILWHFTVFFCVNFSEQNSYMSLARLSRLEEPIHSHTLCFISQPPAIRDLTNSMRSLFSSFTFSVFLCVWGSCRVLFALQTHSQCSASWDISLHSTALFQILKGHWSPSVKAWCSSGGNSFRPLCTVQHLVNGHKSYNIIFLTHKGAEDTNLDEQNFRKW